MFEKQIEVQPGQRLTLSQMGGEVKVEAWDQAAVWVQLREGTEQDLTVEQAEAGPVLSARRACEIRMPAGLPLTVREARGNLEVQGLAELNVEQVRGNLKLEEVAQATLAEVYGNLRAGETATLRLVGTVYGNAQIKKVQSAELQNVRGNLEAKEVEQMRVSRVGGNMHAKEIGGTLEATQVGGNAALKNVTGAVTADQVAGNLAARHLVGGAKVARIGGNLAFNGDLGQARTYQFKADGNAILRLSEEANAHVVLTAGGHIASSLKLADEERESHRLAGRLGDGGAEIAVDAGGNLALAGGGGGIDADLSEELRRQAEESLSAIDLEAIGRHVNEEMDQALSRLRVKLEGVDWERVGERAQVGVQAAMERMHREMERAAEHAARHQERLARRAEREAQRAERLAERRHRVVHAGAGATVEVGAADEPDPSRAEPAEAGPNLDQERLAVLKMVEQGQITPEEGEMLLAALE